MYDTIPHSASPFDDLRVEVVQDSLVALHGQWRRLRDSEKALSYLRQSVVNRSRSVLLHLADRATAGQEWRAAASSAAAG